MEQVTESPFEVSDREDGISTTSSSRGDESMLGDSVYDSVYGDQDGEGKSFTTNGTKHTEQQHRAIVYRGMIVLCIMTFLGLALGSSTYFLLAASQEKEFETEFESFAREAADIAENNAENAFGQFRTLATAITSAAIDEKEGFEYVPDTIEGIYDNETESIFPKVTIPHFDLRAQEISKLTGAEMIMFVPFVEQADRSAWEEYSTKNHWWIEQDYGYRGWDPTGVEPVAEELYSLPWFAELNDTRRGYTDEDGFMEDILAERHYDSEDLSAPVAQYGPGLLDTSLVKLDLFAHQIFKKEIIASLEYDVPVISEPTNLDFLLDYLEAVPNSTSLNRELLRSFTLDQVKEDFHEDSKTVGYLVGILPWSTFFSNLLPENVNGIVVEIVSDCGSAFTYTINGDRADVESLGSQHNPRYDGMQLEFRFFWKEHPKGRSRHCHFDLVVYPSQEFEDAYKNNTPLILAVVVAVSFIGLGIFFFIFSMIMARRQRKVQLQVKQVEAIVTSVFPKSIGERLIAEATDTDLTSIGGASSMKGLGAPPVPLRSKPLADLFLNTTVVFADIVGFTAWSSTREPSQVFILLETIYRDFDKITLRRGVYKVETVGDCYVAVSGLPKPRHDHFVAAAHFAGDVLSRMSVLTSQIECELGPDTADLGIRIGIHSGPVTAGVLRGERARFQLFGDTVNTAARMETTGQKNRIQISQQTADLLEGVGKGHWFIPREDKVVAKGKGELQTFWLDRINGAASFSLMSTNSRSSIRHKKQQFSANTMFRNSFLEAPQNKKIERLVNWNVEILSTLLKQIEERRRLTGSTKPLNADAEKKLARFEQELVSSGEDTTVIDEVVEIINLPRFKADREADNSQPVTLSKAACSQLRQYITGVAHVYEANSFHNFEHASHVTMSVLKLLGRIVAPESIVSDDARELHDHTYGITSDPLTQFAVVFSAILHDADHPGVPNMQLVKEQTEEAVFYKNKSVAEQHSIDLCWNMLMEDEFVDLRRAIYKTSADLRRFRNLVVNSVMATDIMDPSLKKLRNDRWDKAFSKGEGNKILAESEIDQANRKATVVIEHLIQASDVAHTMQHWDVYRKWNSRLFMETYVAFLKGRNQTDPSISWYKGEIGFFDFYIIPLAKKLDECGVFGVSSHEYLNYAEENRAEWERKGERIVVELKAEAAAKLNMGDSVTE